MSVDYIQTLGFTKAMLDGYQELHSTSFPGGSTTHYDKVLLSTHAYLNEHVHPTVQTRSALHGEGIYLTDHGPKHIELVMKRASQLVRTEKSLLSAGSKNEIYDSCLKPYEVFLLAMGIHFHDVGNMYGRENHEQRILEEMQKIGALSIPLHQKIIISRIATCHGGTIDGSKDTIKSLPNGWEQDGDASYRPMMLAAVLRLADELADEHSRADTYGLLQPNNLPPTCLLYHKYAEGLRVSLDLQSGFIGLNFSLYVDDLRSSFPKRRKDGTTVNQFLIDELYERTLKTFSEMQYCARYMRSLDVRLHEVRVDILIYPHKFTSTSVRQLHYIIGDTDYPDHSGKEKEALRRLAREFSQVLDGPQLALTLPATPSFSKP